MKFKTVCVLSIALFLLCVSPSLGKKPPKPPNPGEVERTRYEAYLEAGSYSGDGVLLTGDLGTSSMPNDCETSFRAHFNLRAPLALVPADGQPAVILPGVDLIIGTDDDVEILADPELWGYPTGSGFSVVLAQSEPGYIDSVALEIRSFPDQDFYRAKLEGLDVVHPCPIDNGLPRQAFEIVIDQTLEVWRQKGNKYVGDIYVGRLVFYYDCDQDQNTANPVGCG